MTERSTGRTSMAQTEQELRVQLAACYRIFDHMGWSEMIYNHITAKVPGPEHHFLINPYGLHYREVTASNLVKVDIDGNIVEHTDYAVNPAGIVIHTAIHAARPDIQCIAHTHTNAGMAVACTQEGLRTDNFYSALLHNQIAYHDFEGITVNDEEKPRLIANLGDKSLMILRNHGLLAGGRTIPEAFQNLWAMERACQVQVTTDSTGRPNIPVGPEILAKSEQLMAMQAMGGPSGELEFKALTRLIEKIDPSYKD
ncbi:class II aldolase/adducin family protein [Porticoccaceae bacterium]|nr:class II aldolase/adducin family protein [SAR92 clade bacterium H231]MDA7815349.1 class II aldolase/adducin family protein [Porticoccaceae bacterium]MDA7853516.1 class II aldolase/adducin family protein [Porticoccaceae bacterium]MDA8902410.1 class II aldolase/adducin family protein [Porticoccaceae bacterium]MDA8936793.1 class II aldolase/adducin family protein [Porticoccaceae bacterium]